LERFLILYPSVNFFIQLDEKIKRFYRTSFNERVAQIFKCTVEDGFNVDACKDDTTVSGWFGLPGIHRRSADHILLYANGRPIEDKMLLQAVRFAYQDTVPKDRFPCLVLFLNLPPEDLDVNVHPAKIHVRFKDPQEIRQAVVTIVRTALMEHGRKTAFTAPTNTEAIPMSSHALPLSTPSTDTWAPGPIDDGAVRPFAAYAPPPQIPQHFHRFYDRPIKTLQEQEGQSTPMPMQRTLPVMDFQASGAQTLDLGYAIGQIHQQYIVAANPQGLVIVDPHGAHERALYERMKSQWTSDDVQLLIPSLPLNLTESEQLHVTIHQDALSEAGFPLKIQEGVYHLTGIPAVLHAQSPGDLWESVLTLLQEENETTPLEIRQTLVHRILAYWSCRKSVFLGDTLSLEEMNALLRMMEQTPNAAQCNHGRNVYRVFSLAQMSTWFDRT
jgi:DNA mismatch repair protein MutL